MYENYISASPGWFFEFDIPTRKVFYKFHFAIVMSLVQVPLTAIFRWKRKERQGRVKQLLLSQKVWYPAYASVKWGSCAKTLILLCRCCSFHYCKNISEKCVLSEITGILLFNFVPEEDVCWKIGIKLEPWLPFLSLNYSNRYKLN